MNEEEKTKLWKQRESELLNKAKEIYKNSKEFDSNVNLDALGNKVYDLMSEESWETFRKFEKEIKLKFGSIE